MSSRGLEAELERRCRPSARPPWVGVEHEYRVLADGEVVDFREVVGSLSVGARGLDPGDANALRCPWGGVLTADGREAEIATPPNEVSAGFAVTLDRQAAEAARALRAALAPAGIDGYSTHISVEVQDRAVIAAGRRFVRRYASSMMLLLDRTTSPGLLVRPRRGRLEVCGDHVVGEQLVAATVFATAASLDCLSRRPRGTAGFRSVAPAPRSEPAVERYGWYVDRLAFGVDLYRGGRSAVLPGGRRAQDQLECSWERLRPLATGFCAAEELEIADGVVGGSVPLPCEAVGAELRGGVHGGGAPTWGQGPAPTWGQGPFASAIRVRRVGDLVVEPRVVTWPVVVLAVSDGEAEILLSIPGRMLDTVLDRLDGGDLDDLLVAAVASRGHLGALDPEEAGAGVGVHDRIEDAKRLAPPERDPLTGRIGGRGGGDREQKHRSDEHPRAPRGRRVPRRLAVGAVVAAVVLVAVVSALALTMGRPATDQAVTLPADPAPPASPTAFTREEARALEGAYDLTTTVIDGNENFPVGTTRAATFRLIATCRGGQCTVEGDSGLGRATRSDGGIRFAGTHRGPCETDPAISTTDSYDVVLRSSGPDRLTGENRQTTIDVAGCPNTTVDPVVFRWEAVRR